MSKVIRQQEIETYESESRPGTWYTVKINHDDEANAYLSCNCKGWTTSTRHKGKQAWERNCGHTYKAVFNRMGLVVRFLDQCSGRVEWWENGRQVSVSEASQRPVKPAGGRPKKREKPADSRASRFTQLEV